MIAYCGLDCKKCECYMATKENNDTLRSEVAEKWSKQYNADIKPEHINCTGCKSEGVKFHFTETGCPIRKCNIEKNTPNCAGCSQYRCEKLNNFIAMEPIIGDTLEKLR